MRKPLIAGNWKMFLTRSTGAELAKAIADGSGNVGDRDILVCPSFALLSDVSEAVKGSNVLTGAQNMHFENDGAFTGEVSADMLLSVSCSYVLLGHSERRHVFHEKDETINKKVLFALKKGLKPILCVGELLSERESGSTESVVKDQVTSGLKDVGKDNIGSVTIAYEPVWAIGTGKTATPEDADGVHSYIRSIISDLYGSGISENTRILYGGSVKPGNVDGLMAKGNIDGALVGGASLDADSFLRIINFKN
jgi:triosephosphate isomerase